MTNSRPILKNLVPALTFAGSTYLFLVVSISLFHLTIDPVWGWDALDFWIKSSVDIISADETRHWDHRHPKYVSMIFGSLGVPAALGIININLLPYLFLLVVFYVGCITVGRFRVSALAPLLVIATMPLVENHLSIPGYSEVFCIILSGLSTTFLCIGLDSKKIIFVAVGLAVSCSLVFVRSTAFMYAGCTVLSFAICVVHRGLGWRSLLGLLGVCTLALVIAINTTWAIDVGRFRYGFDTERNLIYFSEYVFSASLPNLSTFLTTVIWSVFVNSSFSVFFIAAAICFMVKSCVASNLFLKYDFVVSITLFMLILVSPNVLQYSVVETDTSYSRFILAGLGGAILYVTRSVSALTLMPRRVNNNQPN